MPQKSDSPAIFFNEWETWDPVRRNGLLKGTSYLAEEVLDPRPPNTKTRLVSHSTHINDKLSCGRFDQKCPGFPGFLSQHSACYMPGTLLRMQQIQTGPRSDSEKRASAPTSNNFRCTNNLGLPGLAHVCPYTVRAAIWLRSRSRWHAAARRGLPDVGCEIQTADSKM